MFIEVNFLVAIYIEDIKFLVHKPFIPFETKQPIAKAKYSLRKCLRFKKSQDCKGQLKILTKKKTADIYRAERCLALIRQRKRINLLPIQYRLPDENVL